MRNHIESPRNNVEVNPSLPDGLTPPTTANQLRENRINGYIFLGAAFANVLVSMMYLSGSKNFNAGIYCLAAAAFYEAARSKFSKS